MAATLKSEEAWLSQTLSSLRRSRSPKPPSPFPQKGLAKRQQARETAKDINELSPEVHAWLSKTLDSLSSEDFGRTPREGPCEAEPELNMSAALAAALSAASTPTNVNATPKAPLATAGGEDEQGGQVSQRGPDMSAHIASRGGGGANIESLKAILPDPQGILRRLRAGAEGLTEDEIPKVASAFQRFKVPDSNDLHKDDLCHVLKHLGFLNVESQTVAKLAEEITYYSTLDLDQFTHFVEKFAACERDYFKEVFNKFDEDHSGSLDQEELGKYLSSLGFTPLRKMVHEAFEMVDLDGSGTLDFEETVLLMALYRNSEGFASEDVDELAKFFADNVKDEEEQEQTVPADKLAVVLMNYFGPAAEEAAEELSKEVHRQSDSAEVDGEVPLGLSFPEMLTWARRLRDKEIDRYKEGFAKYDTDGSGYIDMYELQEVVTSLGITLTRLAMDEIICKAREKEAKKLHKEIMPIPETGVQLDFDEFVNVMEIFREADGFTEKELEHLKGTFDHFDGDGSGEIDTIELCNVLSYLGHHTKLFTVQTLVEKVDFDGSGGLSFREFTRLMRLHREEELVRVKKEFVAELGDKDLWRSSISNDGALAALEALEFRDEELDQLEASGALKGESVSFDDFVALVDAARTVRVCELRKRAGFSDKDIEEFRRLFRTVDKEKNGFLDTQELRTMLHEMGISTDFRTKDEQQGFLQMLEVARKEAAVRGDTDPGEGTQVSFWVIVQLLRALQQKSDRKTLDKITIAMEESKFTAPEVAQFREVFLSWWEKDSAFDKETTLGVLQKEKDEFPDDAKEITRAGLRRLLRSMGMKMDHQQRAQLDAKAAEIHGVHDDKIDFADLLRIMRWMMDTNFADIGNAAAIASKPET